MARFARGARLNSQFYPLVRVDVEVETIGSLNSIVLLPRRILITAVVPGFESATSRRNCDGSSILAGH